MFLMMFKNEDVVEWMAVVSKKLSGEWKGGNKYGRTRAADQSRLRDQTTKSEGACLAHDP